MRHNTPRYGDRVYIDGVWREETKCEFDTCPHGNPNWCFGKCILIDTRVWIKSKLSRVNGIVRYVDRDTEEATIHFIDHPYADVDEPKTLHLPFSIFYGRWDANRDLFVLTDECVS